MAISNVFGSNTFNMLVGLGFPWLLYTTILDVEYSDLPADGIDESMIIMITALLIFIIMVLASGFELLEWHAYSFYVMYILFLIRYIGQCFI